MLARYGYDVFGAIRNETGTSDNTRKFTGKEFDADSNLYYYGARYYDPYIGRFTQRDPIGDGINWYAYVANNPLAFVDPTGLELHFVASAYSIKHVSDLDDFYLGELTNAGDIALFYALVGIPKTTDTDVGDTISLDKLQATKGILADVINHDKPFTLGWADLGENVYGLYVSEFGFNKLRINNNSEHGYATDLATLLDKETSSNKNFKSLRLTLAHELQHVVNHFNNELPSGIRIPKIIRPDLHAQWLDEYSAYRTELSAAHQLGHFSGGYFASSFDPLAAQRGPTRPKSIQAIRDAATGNVLSK